MSFCVMRAVHRKVLHPGRLDNRESRARVNARFKTVEGLPFGACYTRVLWADLEPEEGKYDWSKIDKAISWGEKNKIPASFRIMCANYHSKGRYSTPEWVFKKGVKSSEFSWEKKDQIPSKPMTTLVRVTPHFDDPIFIKEHSKFIKKLAERYDGDPRIAFIDIGSYGNWGEWHTHRLGIPRTRSENPEKSTPTCIWTISKKPLSYS